jgi:hypothetical protein
MKRVLIVLLVLVGAGVAALWLSIDRIVSSQIESNASHALGVETKVGLVVVRPISGQIRIGSLRVANPPGFEGDLLRFDEFELHAEYGSLRREVVSVPLFRLEGVEVSLQRRGDESNTDVILNNLKRFESGSKPKQPPEEEGPPQRFKVAKLLIRDVDAHVEWSSFASKQSALEVHLDGIELTNPGGARGLTLPELSDVVVKAVLDSIRKSGQLPVEVARDLAGGLRGLTKLPFEITGGVLGEAGKLLPGPAADALDAAGGAVGEAGKLLDKGFGKLLGGDDEKKE